MRIIGENPEQLKVKALEGFRNFGFYLFIRGLRRDCIRRLEDKFGKAWPLMCLVTSSGGMSRFAREKEAMRHML